MTEHDQVLAAVEQQFAVERAEATHHWLTAVRDQLHALLVLLRAEDATDEARAWVRMLIPSAPGPSAAEGRMGGQPCVYCGRGQ